MLALQGTSAGAADLAATARVAFLVFVLPLPLFASLAVMVSRRAGWRALLVLWAVVVLGLIGTAAVRTLTSPVLRSRTAPIGGAFGLSLGILLYYGLAFGSGRSFHGGWVVVRRRAVRGGFTRSERSQQRFLAQWRRSWLAYCSTWLH